MGGRAVGWMDGLTWCCLSPTSGWPLLPWMARHRSNTTPAGEVRGESQLADHRTGEEVETAAGEDLGRRGAWERLHPHLALHSLALLIARSSPVRCVAQPVARCSRETADAVTRRQHTG